MEENTQKQKEQGISVADLLEILRGGIVWIIIITLISLGLGIGYAFGMRKTTYTAKLNAYYYVSSYENINGEKYEVSEHTRYQYSALLAKDCESVFKSNDIVSVVAPKVPGVVVSSIRFTVNDDSPLFTISYSMSVKGGDPKVHREQVAKILNDYVNESIEVINKDEGEPHWHKDKIFVNSLATASAVSDDQQSGRTKTIILAFVAGLALAVVFVLLKHFLDDTVNSREQVELITGTQIIALIDISANMNDDIKVDTTPAEGGN